MDAMNGRGCGSSNVKARSRLFHCIHWISHTMFPLRSQGYTAPYQEMYPPRALALMRKNVTYSIHMETFSIFDPDTIYGYT